MIKIQRFYLSNHHSLKCQNWLLVILILLATISFKGWASEANNDSTKNSEIYNPVPAIMHHISDSHEWHLWGEGKSSMTIPLPVILWTDLGLVMFSSSEFHHNDDAKVVVSKNNLNFPPDLSSEGTYPKKPHTIGPGS